jgi:ATP-dependent metalloprotease
MFAHATARFHVLTRAPLPHPSSSSSTGLARDVASRVESGRFAMSLDACDVYTRALVAMYRLPESGAGAANARLRALVSGAPWRGGGAAGGGAFVAPDALAAAVAGSSGGSGGGGGGGGFGAGAAAGAGSAEAYERLRAAAAGGGSGTAANPLVVEVAPGRPTFADRLALIAKVASWLAIGGLLLSMANSKVVSPLAALTGSVADEVADIPKTRFADVKGADEPKAELQDVVAFLRDPERYKRLGAKVPSGVLLTGPPGTGKTLLARAIAGEAGCAFYAKSASEFEEMLVGLGAKRVRELFASARKNAPAIIFIDEIDAMGSRRTSAVGGSNSERQTLNQLLSCMDGFTKTEGVIVIGATNSPQTLDPALVRPGRFDTTVDVPLPDVKGRREILDLYFGRVAAGADIDSALLARATPGFSGAQLEALVNSAALMAAKRDSDVVEAADCEEARDKLIMGPAKLSRVRTPALNRLVAYHEGGHTLTAMLTRGANKLHKVTILPRGSSGGATFSLPDDSTLRTRETYLATIDVCMGGRVAEELIFGAELVTDGAASDMQQASRLARALCAAYSMSDAGLSFFGDGEWKASPERAAVLDNEVEKILRASYERVKALLGARRADLDRLANALVSGAACKGGSARQNTHPPPPPPD